MRIENDVKYDYSDVLIRPKRSTLTSRKEVSLERTYKLKNKYWSGIPIMAANMDGVGTIEMAKVLTQQKMFTCLKKTYDTSQLVEFFSNKENCEYTAMSIGISDYDFRKFCDVYSMCQHLKFVCVDVASSNVPRASCDPPLKPNHPNHNTKVPRVAREIEEAAKGVKWAPFTNLPNLGPNTIAPANAAAPPAA